jgi:diguanylate cyclase (GGDEF)-like protein
MGAPLGLLILRAVQSESAFELAWISAEVQADPALYLYLSVATTSVLSALGLLIGRYDDRLLLAALTDPLTGLPNRRRFTEALAAEIARSRRYGASLSVLLIDVDQFKRVNDRHGHAAGDTALSQVAASLRSTCRQTDLPARYGGDEFALLLPETAGDRGQLLAGRLATSLRAAPPYAVNAPALTLSIGVAELAQGDDPGTLLKRADEALYQAKAAGRDRSVLASGERVLTPT